MVTLAVTLESGREATVVRSETVPWLAFGPPDDVAWQVDQYTQETIATSLAELGWEAIAEDRWGADRAGDDLFHSAVYSVRNLSMPVVTWDDLK